MADDKKQELDNDDDDDAFEYDTETVSAQLEDFVIETLDVNDSNFKNEIHVKALVENSSFELKVDSGETQEDLKFLKAEFKVLCEPKKNVTM